MKVEYIGNAFNNGKDNEPLGYCVVHFCREEGFKCSSLSMCLKHNCVVRTGCTYKCPRNFYIAD